MASYDLHVVKGQSVGITFTVNNVPESEAIATATLTIREKEGAAASLVSKTINTVLSSDGQVTDAEAGGSATLLFLLSAANTNALNATKPFCVYSVSYTTSGGGTGVTIAVGSIFVRTKV